MWKYKENLVASLLVSSNQVFIALFNSIHDKVCSNESGFTYVPDVDGWKAVREMGFLLSFNGHSAIKMCLAQHDSQTLSIL